MRVQPSWINFVRSWQLNVYFQIRFRDIATAFEEQLPDKAYKRDEAAVASSNARELAQLLQLIWSQRVVLRPLASKFAKMTLSVKTFLFSNRQAIGRIKAAYVSVAAASTNQDLLIGAVIDLRFIQAQVRRCLPFMTSSGPRSRRPFEIAL